MSVSFVPREGAVLPAEAMTNHWPGNWLKEWFYYQVPEEGTLDSWCKPIYYTRVPEPPCMLAVEE